MNVSGFKIDGPKLIEPKVFGDGRGFFSERFRVDAFRELGLPEFIQDNYSRSQTRVLRGMHFQYDRPQSKLVTATTGRILDVIVDVRSKSPSFGQSISVELDGQKPAWLWVPAGFAHGFLVLSPEGADVMYKVDTPYNPRGEGGICWNDRDLAIEWPVKDPEVSPRDGVLPAWTEYLKAPRF